MLHARAEPGHEEATEERQVASREAGGDEAKRGGRRAGGEDGAGSAHVPDCVMDVTTVLATPPLFPSKGHARTGDPRHQRLLLVVYSAVDEAHRAAALYELVGGRDLTRPQHLRHRVPPIATRRP